jgi:hypothetical protein
MRIALWTTYFECTDTVRKTEFLTSIRINSENPSIDTIYVLAENVETFPLDHSKIKVIPVLERPSYSTFFHLYKTYELTDTINILINTDIVLDYRHMDHFKLIQPNMLFALSRYEVASVPTSFEDLLTARVELVEDTREYYSSQDVWAIRGFPPNPHIFTEKLGIPKCDGRTAFHFHKLGYSVFNPCLSIYTYHIHVSKSRDYLDQCPGDTIFIRPTNIAAIYKPASTQIYTHNDSLPATPKILSFLFTNKL